MGYIVFFFSIFTVIIKLTAINKSYHVTLKTIEECKLLEIRL
ncbi:hypothetical protein SAMN02787073_3279 [Chryseobacterium vrystaatense]|uniref:Uncharacterized protein n=1 Tax=Chryseobacterium vrystaatense TaxID=307480 RepID=A0A1M5G9F2_9FLAO|nr:hypothetical protein SAMN02787073_3279 [Chryseobacterium vrystaatense]